MIKHERSDIIVAKLINLFISIKIIYLKFKKFNYTSYFNKII